MSMKWWTANSSPRAEEERTGRRRIGHASRLALLGAGLAIALAGCSLLPDEPEEEDLSAIQLPQISKKPEYEVTTKTLEQTASGSGRMLSTQEKTMYFTIGDRRIKALHVQPGDQVTEGQVIAELDVEDLEKSLRTEKLAFKQQELQMKETLRQKDEMDPVEFETKKLQFEEARQRLLDMEADIDKAVMTAPFAGTIVSLSVQEGGLVKAYDPVCVVADTSELIVAATLSKNDLEKVAVGMEVKVDINNAGELKGKVKSLPSPESDNNQGQGAQVERLDKYLLVEVPDLPETVTRGTPLSVSVVVNRTENAVVIPISALRSVGARTYVQVVEADGSKREVDVAVGQQTSTDVEILEGLTPGQKVVGR